MGKRLKVSSIIFRIVFAISIFFILYMFMIITNDGSVFHVYGNINKYTKKTSAYDNITRMSTFAVCDEQLYYVHPKTNELYQYIDTGDDTLIDKTKMDYIILDNQKIIFIRNQELYIKHLGSTAIRKISDIYKNYKRSIAYVDNRLFFINQDTQLCLYDINRETLKIISGKYTFDFEFYGNYIFFENCRGLYAANILDGTQKKKLTNASMYSFCIAEDYIFFSNDSSMLYRIDMRDSSHSVLVEWVSPFGLETMDEKLYFLDYTEDRTRYWRFVQSDFNGHNKIIVKEYDFLDNYRILKTEHFYYDVYEKARGQNKDTYIKVTDYKGDIHKDVSLPLAHVFSVKEHGDIIIMEISMNEENTLIIFDNDLNELERVG